jgi:7-keto-8-aminopelargonate synthetase-like enzyme
MDGDFAPLERLCELARRHDCLLVVDEAHAIGVLGGGGGLCRQLGLSGAPDVIVGTLSKSLGGYGGFAACSAAMRELLVNRARSFIYSTALPPACAASAIAAIDVLAGQPQMGTELLSRAKAFREDLAARGLKLGPSACQIVPVMVGANDKALAMADRLRERRILVTAIRPPTVPAGTARLRLSVTLAHTPADLAAAAAAMEAVA